MFEIKLNFIKYDIYLFLTDYIYGLYYKFSFKRNWG